MTGVQKLFFYLSAAFSSNLPILTWEVNLLSCQFVELILHRLLSVKEKKNLGLACHLTNQVPDGEFLCPKCKTDEATTCPPTPSSKAKTARIKTIDAANGPSAQWQRSIGENGPSTYGRKADNGHLPRGSVAGVGEGAGGVADSQEGGVEGGDVGFAVLATDESMVGVTMIAK